MYLHILVTEKVLAPTISSLLHFIPSRQIASESRSIAMFSYFLLMHFFLVVTQCLDLDVLANSQIDTFDSIPPKVRFSVVRRQIRIDGYLQVA